MPGPGLTLVVGRNGSGKSSFAEALEVLLTGDLRRWEKLPAVWHKGWRSMHQPGSARDHRGVPRGGRRTGRCAADMAGRRGFAGLLGVRAVAGEKRAGLERLGWARALADYRPFLSHSELEAFFGSPSGLYELLASVLGLEDLTLAATRLAQARKTRESALVEVRKRLPGLLARLESSGDERAAACRSALAGRTWDLAAARSAVTGARVAADGGELDRLRRLAQLTAPAEGDVREAAARSGTPRPDWMQSRARPLAGHGRWPGC